MWYIVGLISLLDLYLGVKFLPINNIIHLQNQEKNPIIVMLISMSGDTSLFVVCKIVGTISVLAIIKWMYTLSFKWGISVCFSVFVAQVSLLFYLSL